MKFTASTDIDRVKPEDLPRYTTMALEQLGQILNNGLLPQDNFSANILTVSFPSPGAEVAVSHSLGRVPTGYIAIGCSTATTLSDGSSASTSSVLYLRASVASSVRVMVF
jgi:hypothetical protein